MIGTEFLSDDVFDVPGPTNVVGAGECGKRAAFSKEWFCGG